MLVDAAAQALERRRLAQHQVQRVNVAAQRVDQAAHVAVGRHDRRQAGAVHHLHRGVAVLRPYARGVFQPAELAVGERGDDVAGKERAVDAVLGDAVADDLAAFQRHAAQGAGGWHE